MRAAPAVKALQVSREGQESSLWAGVIFSLHLQSTSDAKVAQVYSVAEGPTGSFFPNFQLALWEPQSEVKGSEQRHLILFPQDLESTGQQGFSVLIPQPCPSSTLVEEDQSQCQGQQISGATENTFPWEERHFSECTRHQRVVIWRRSSSGLVIFRCLCRSGVPTPWTTDQYWSLRNWVTWQEVSEASSLFTAAFHCSHYHLSSASCQISSGIRFS
ncbi:uncharacterized protein [Chlorocebus sabaeus]|uniref:uncharacterized protein isoform X1 n=1 Tax=Chlorocebus sabaeus TaxID=60711 RepID=UPI003BF9FD7E